MEASRYKNAVNAIENSCCAVTAIRQMNVAGQEKFIRILINEWITFVKKKKFNLRIETK